jgi:hypothetical protein
LIDAESLPAPDSVSPKAARISPEARRGSHFLGPEEDDRNGAEARGRVGERDAAAGFRQLFDHQRHLEDAAAEAFVRRGHEDPEQIGLAEDLHDLPWELAGLVELRGDRRDLLLRDLRGQVLDHLLVVGQEVIHGTLLVARWRQERLPPPIADKFSMD